jgi:hypothetical protein
LKSIIDLTPKTIFKGTGKHQHHNHHVFIEFLLKFKLRTTQKHLFLINNF